MVTEQDRSLVQGWWADWLEEGSGETVQTIPIFWSLTSEKPALPNAYVLILQYSWKPLSRKIFQAQNVKNKKT